MTTPRFLLRRPLAALLLASAAAASAAHGYKLGAIEIGHPYARATAPGQAAGGGFLTLRNAGPADRLLGATTPAADRVELHTMKMEGDVMRMRQVDAIDLPANGSVDLKPGGYHLMLMGLKAPLTVGAKLPMKLRFEKAGEVDVVVNVEAVAGAPAASTATDHKH